MNSKRLALLVVCLHWTVICLRPSAASGQTVVNGGFETPVLGPSGWKEYLSGESFDGWTVSSQQVLHWRSSPIPEFTESDSAETNQAVALDGALFQDFSTSPGRDYLVSFTVIVFNGNDFAPPLRVSFGSASTLFRLEEKPLPAAFALGFTASNAITRLEFRSFGYGVAVDDVTVTPVPRLSITPFNGTHTLIAWHTNFADYALEYATALSGTNWLPVTNTNNHAGERVLVIVDATTGQRVFRLRKP